MKVIHDLEGMSAGQRRVTNRKNHLHVWSFCQSISVEFSPTFKLRRSQIVCSGISVERLLMSISVVFDFPSARGTDQVDFFCWSFRCCPATPMLCTFHLYSERFFDHIHSIAYTYIEILMTHNEIFQLQVKWMSLKYIMMACGRVQQP